jgi:hypothetical protein
LALDGVVTVVGTIAIMMAVIIMKGGAAMARDLAMIAADLYLPDREPDRIFTL